MFLMGMIRLIISALVEAMGSKSARETQLEERVAALEKLLTGREDRRKEVEEVFKTFEARLGPILQSSVQQERERRSAIAKKAHETRKRNLALKAQEAAQRMVRGMELRADGAEKKDEQVQ